MNFTLLVILIIMLPTFLIIRTIKPKKMMKSHTKKATFRISKPTHFKILLGFLGLLVFLTAIGEFVNPGKQSAKPAPVADPNYELLFDSIADQIFNREEVDPSLLVEKRTHPIGQTLTIYNKVENEDYFEGPLIYIERKSDNDQIIEEFVYKPLLVVDGYDFGQKFPITLPIWTEDTMTFKDNTRYDITYTTFQEAILLDQLTKSKSTNHQGYGTPLSLPVIHLKIPKDLEIINEYQEEQLIFIDEFD